MSRWVNKQLPDPDKLYGHLRDSFAKLDSNSDKIPGAQYHTEDSLDKARRQLEKGDESSWKLKLNPYLVFDLDSDRDFANGNGQARLGANIEVSDGEYQMFSSSLILAVQHPSDEDHSLPDGLNHCCIDVGKNEADGSFFHILDRIHWDIDTGKEEDERKPVCHFQLGGKISNSAFEAYEKYHYCSNGLDKPRIPHPPMGPILVFNMLINQYQSLESFNQAQWTGVVKNGETTLWEPYYDATYGMVHNEDSIMMDLMQI